MADKSKSYYKLAQQIKLAYNISNSTIELLYKIYCVAYRLPIIEGEDYIQSISESSGASYDDIQSVFSEAAMELTYQMYVKGGSAEMSWYKNSDKICKNVTYSSKWVSEYKQKRELTPVLADANVISKIADSISDIFNQLKELDVFLGGLENTHSSRTISDIMHAAAYKIVHTEGEGGGKSIFNRGLNLAKHVVAPSRLKYLNCISSEKYGYDPKVKATFNGYKNFIKVLQDEVYDIFSSTNSDMLLDIYGIASHLPDFKSVHNKDGVYADLVAEPLVDDFKSIFSKPVYEWLTHSSYSAGDNSDLEKIAIKMVGEASEDLKPSIKDADNLDSVKTEIERLLMESGGKLYSDEGVPEHKFFSEFIEQLKKEGHGDTFIGTLFEVAAAKYSIKDVVAAYNVAKSEKYVSKFLKPLFPEGEKEYYDSIKPSFDIYNSIVNSAKFIHSNTGYALKEMFTLYYKASKLPDRETPYVESMDDMVKKYVRAFFSEALCKHFYCFVFEGNYTEVEIKTDAMKIKEDELNSPKSDKMYNNFIGALKRGYISKNMVESTRRPGAFQYDYHDSLYWFTSEIEVVSAEIDKLLLSHGVRDFDATDADAQVDEGEGEIEKLLSMIVKNTGWSKSQLEGLMRTATTSLTDSQVESALASATQSEKKYMLCIRRNTVNK